MGARVRKLKRAVAGLVADAKLALSREEPVHFFWIVSTAYQAAPFLERHIRSVASQRYPKDLYRHVLIDDASSDDTERVVRDALRTHGIDNVEYRRNTENLGGCANLTAGFREAPTGSIVLQVDGDDWLPDPRVLAYLDVLYRDRELWMTYNSWRFPDGRPSANSERLPRRVVARASYRDYRWISSHLHSFRRELFEHVLDESLIDPDTGEYFRSSVDMAHYFPMLELAGHHARHVERVTYVYNLHGGSLISSQREKQKEREARIRGLPRYAPLRSLDFPRAARR